jgi:hypothetical protein
MRRAPLASKGAVEARERFLRCGPVRPIHRSPSVMPAGFSSIILVGRGELLTQAFAMLLDRVRKSGCPSPFKPSSPD